jgi:hypothetical protein
VTYAPLASMPDARALRPDATPPSSSSSAVAAAFASGARAAPAAAVTSSSTSRPAATSSSTSSRAKQVATPRGSDLEQRRAKLQALQARRKASENRLRQMGSGGSEGTSGSPSMI